MAPNRAGSQILYQDRRLAGAGTAGTIVLRAPAFGLKAAPKRRPGWLDQQKHKLNRWMTAATLATLVTILVLGGLHWLRVLQG